MAHLLFELGCEELPASMALRANLQLADEIQNRLRDSLISFGACRTLCTPRRLIVGIDGVEDVQATETKRLRGPGLKAAYDSEGKPTKALEGFCRGQGVSVDELEPEGDYVWVNKVIPGRPTIEVLQIVLPEAIRALTLDKTMRWGSGRMRFSRPIRWIVSVFAGEVVEFTLENVASGRASRGHRFISPESFEANTFDELADGLRARSVEPDVALRREKIIREAKLVSEGRADLVEALIAENSQLTEWPTAHLGSFHESFMVLPESVLVTAMAKHEKFFPVRDESGALTNEFVSIRNGGEESEVRRGNEWVLNNRFNDAKFFFDEDAKFSLEDFLTRTESMAFHDRLGSVRLRADRLSALASMLVSVEQKADAAEAGRLAKADLSTGLVGELASLQGIIGGEYARREGRPERVCQAIASQYQLQNLPTDEVALAVIAADQIDKLAGYLGIGLAPTGSSDPYGLRRAATTLIDIAWIWPHSLDLKDLLANAVKQYEAQGFELEDASETLRSILAQRLEASLEEVRYDIRSAAIERGPTEPQAVRFAVEVQTILSQDPALVQALSRPANIVRSAIEKGSFTPGHPISKLDSEAAESLQRAILQSAAPLKSAQTGLEFVQELRQLQTPINVFFDTVMVMVEDVETRNSRLQLLSDLVELIQLGGDPTKLVIE